MPAVVRALSTAASVLRTSVLTGAISLTARMAVVLPAPAVPQIRIFSSLMHGGSRQLGKPLADAAENALGRTRGSAAAGCRGGPAQQADGIEAVQEGHAGLRGKARGPAQPLQGGGAAPAQRWQAHVVRAWQQPLGRAAQQP